MKIKYLFLFFILLNSCQKRNYIPNKGCYSDEGIKKGIIYSEIKNDSSAFKVKESKTIHYNRKGQPTLIQNSHNYEFKREYNGDKLQLIIKTYNTNFAFYDIHGQIDSSVSNFEWKTDTALITKHHPDGRPIKIIEFDNTILFFDYEECKIVKHTTLKENGDTIQKYQSKFKEGVLIETIWTSYFPTKYNVKTIYYGYKFNRKGHWIKRNYKYQNGDIIIENRELTYY